MEYLVFPFGKYKGVKLKDLPSTYIVLALEKFDLPNELESELYFIALGRLTAFSTIGCSFIESESNEHFMDWITFNMKKYEKL